MDLENEHRTSNIERRMIEEPDKLSEPGETLTILASDNPENQELIKYFITRFAGDKKVEPVTINFGGAKRPHYSMFDVGRSMFDVQYLQHADVEHTATLN